MFYSIEVSRNIILIVSLAIIIKVLRLHVYRSHLCMIKNRTKYNFQYKEQNIAVFTVYTNSLYLVGVRIPQ